MLDLDKVTDVIPLHYIVGSLLRNRFGDEPEKVGLYVTEFIMRSGEQLQTGRFRAYKIVVDTMDYLQPLVMFHT